MEGEPLWCAGAEHTRAELDCLVRVGALEHLLLDLYCPRGTADARVRAAALRAIVLPRVADGSTVIGPTAAWVHLGGSAPERLHVAVAFFHRCPPTDGRVRWRFTQTDVAAGPSSAAPAEADVQIVDGLRVTSWERTVVDLLLSGEPTDVRAAARLLRWVEPDAVRERLGAVAGRRRTGSVAARARLERLAHTLSTA